MRSRDPRRQIDKEWRHLGAHGEPGVEVAQPRGLVPGERPAPGALGEQVHILHVARLRVAEGRAHRVVLVLQVPHELPGTNPFLGEFGKKYNLPMEVTQGGAATMYPEAARKLEAERNAKPATRAAAK